MSAALIILESRCVFVRRRLLLSTRPGAATCGRLDTIVESNNVGFCFVRIAETM